MRKITLFLLPLIFSSVCAANEQGTAVAASNSQERITVQNLSRVIISNPSAAREQYVGKTLQITGVVVSTGMSRFLTPYVELSDRAGGQVLARCVLPYGGITRGRNQLSNFTVGQIVTISGRVQAVFENAGNSYPNINYGILTKDSRLVE